MKTGKVSMMVTTVILIMTWAPFTFGAVSPEEAAKLGTTLTRFGAEMVGNKDGTITPYTGGLTKPPSGFKPGSGVRPDPFAAEKPSFSINAQNMAQYADKLTEGTKALMKKYPTFRIDIYKTHRTVAYPEYVLKNTATNAIRAKTANDGLSVRDAHAGIPFPIPKDGHEVMWNHLMRYQGRSLESRTTTDLIDASGRLIPAAGTLMWQEFPYYDEDPSHPQAHIFWKDRWHFDRPTRKMGEAGQLEDPVNMYEKGRVCYQYLPGQRRVKLAPEIGFDTPSVDACGIGTFDEEWLFNGSQERYKFKLIGKKEIYVPYNTYKATYQVKRIELAGPKHINPDLIRWELHRMWVVEGTLRPGKRHIYPKRVLYVDEDSWCASAQETYDASGQMFKADYNYQAPSYDMPAPNAMFWNQYHFPSSAYSISFWPGEGGYIRMVPVRPDRDWAPASLAGRGLR